MTKKSKTSTDIRSQIAARIELLGVTRAEVASRAAITPANLSDYLNGKSEMNAATVERIAKALDAQWLLRATPNGRK
jgi:transcriptional regulator with XRE-family HTH domain